MLQPQSSQYIQDQRREFSLYTLQSRAIPHLADGLKVAHRRVLWTARDGSHFKTATLAGLTMSIHPHSAPEDSINTITAPYSNNVPLFDGDGAFGTYLIPDAYGAGRYTAVSTSKFTNEVIFRDIEIVPMINNYDDTTTEPKHFLPLVPVCLLNPMSGIAVGFACNILPRSLKDIITAQINYLKGKKLPDVIYPILHPCNQQALDFQVDPVSNNIKWTFIGKFSRTKKNEILVTDLPYGVKYTKFIDHLEKLKEIGRILSYDDNSKEKVNITIRVSKSVFEEYSDADFTQVLKLVNSETENLNVIDFDSNTVVQTNFKDAITRFTEWRLQWYVNRYERLLQLLQIDIQRYKDIISAIKHNIGSIAKKIESRAELIEYLEAINIVHVDYIASLPVYRFTMDEKRKVEERLEKALETEAHYQMLLSNEDARRDVYIQELQDVMATHCKKK